MSWAILTNVSGGLGVAGHENAANSHNRPIADIEVFEVTAGQPTYAEIHNHGRNDRLQAYQYSK